MKKLIVLLILLLAWPASGQVVSGKITASGGTFVAQSLNTANGTVTITGTWVGTLQFEGTIDGTNWFSINATPVTGGSAVTSTTANGNWTIGVAVQRVRVRASAWTSGTATVNVLVTAARSGGSSGSSQTASARAADYILSVSGTTVSAYNSKTNAVDFTGTDAGAIINSVVAALTTGGDIYALDGTYNVTTPAVLASNITLRCGSWGANFVEQSGMTVGSAVIQLGGAGFANTRLEGCQITGRQSDTTEGIFGVAITTASSTIDRAQVVRNYIHDTSDSGVVIGGATTGNLRMIEVVNNFFATNGNSHAGNLGDCVSFNGAGNIQQVVISHNVCSLAFRSGVRSTNLSGSFYGVTISENVIYQAAQGGGANSGIHVNTDVNVIGNWVHLQGSGDGIQILAGNVNQGTIVSGNVVNSVGAAGIEVGSGATKIALLNNYLRANGSGIIIATNTTDVTANGNRMSENTNDIGTTTTLIGCNYVGTSATKLTCNLGSGLGTGSPVQQANIQTSSTGIGNGADTTDDTLFTYSLPINSMSANGKSVKVRGWGKTAANANNKQTKLWFAGTAIADSGIIALNASSFSIEYECVRIDATHVSCVGSWQDNGLATENVTTQINLVVSDLTANASIIKLTGASTTSGAANDILGYGMKTYFEN